MNKCIILSVKPEHLHKILTGKKTIEIRKSMPKCELPIDVYLYCTKSKPFLMVGINGDKTFLDNGGKNSSYSPDHNYIGNKRIVSKFTLNKIDKINNCGSCFEIANESYAYTNVIGKRSCLDFNDMKKYLDNGNGYAWHIDNLEIFDKPMRLNDFYRNNFDKDEAKPCNCGILCEYSDYDYVENQSFCGIDYDGSTCPSLKVQRPPMSWFYAYKE